MDSSEPTRTCKQCQREVAEANFALHETHCSRFLCVCPDCGDNVPRDQLTEHREEQHSLVRCSKCSQKMERCRLEDHELEECVERLQSCEFCELQLPFKDLADHVAFCGSRTERCQDCGRYVKLSEQSQHHLTCSASDDDPSLTSATQTQTATCVSCKGSFPVEEIDEHELDCVAASRGECELEEEEDEEDDWGHPWGAAAAAISSTYQRMSMSGGAGSGFQDEDDVNQIGSCPHCGLALPLLTLRWHQKKCQIHGQLK
ncbi:XIAP-associated factor 1 [Salarias fasciatus]|uniref:TRAF-type domain-containing protein n=1 Tax=Salarias fasciatus TaxID=181472 RepID=A0A672IXW4_SALFA|nr:XIAP-associated factor 1 [Salarias fasciatus]